MIRAEALPLLPLALIAAVACDPLEDSGDAECFDVWAEPAAVEVAAESDVPGGALFTVAASDDLAGTTAVHRATLNLRVTHLGEDEDCGVAVYVSDVEPDLAALPVIEPSTSPPEQIDGLGERVGSARLARDAADQPDSEDFLIGLPVSARSFVTVAGCPGAALSASAQLVVDVCAADWEAVPYEPALVSVAE